jgi:hypothetical protein
MSAIPDWAITFWPLWPTLFLFAFFGLLSLLAPIFAGPWSSEGESMEIAMKVASWLSMALWGLWGLLWAARLFFQMICWICGGCNA